MNLLGAILYDPSSSATKACTANIAMTAFDTTNLRQTVTVPAHGMVRVKMMCAIEGAATYPQILLGVMVGASVKGRVSPQITINGTALATTRGVAMAEFTITGLTPGSTVFDAAYGVEFLVASSNIRYGGPDNTTASDAWGAFVFEIWDPRPLPTATPGAANGLQICGSNAATTYATLTSTGAFSVNGVNAISQTGDNFARLGAPVGASISADIASVKTDTGTTIPGRLPVALDANGFMKADVEDWKGATAPAMTGDAFARLGAPAGASVSADVAAINAKTTNLPASPASTTNITSATGITVSTNNDKTGYGLSAAAVQAIWDALTSALTTVGSIGKLLVTNIDAAISSRLSTAGYTTPPTAAAIRTEMDSNSTKLVNLDATISSRTKPADTQAAVTIVNGLAANVITAASINAAALNGKGDWNVGKTGYSLSAGGVQAIWDTLTSALTTSGSIGKWILDKLDVVLSTRLATSGYTAPLDAAATRSAVGLTSANLDTQLDALPTNSELATALAGADDATLAAIGALNNVSSAQVQTAAAAALTAYDPPTRAEATSDKDEIITEVNANETKIDAVKAKTDQLVFTIPGEVDANVKCVNDIEITGTGEANDSWGPV